MANNSRHGFARLSAETVGEIIQYLAAPSLTTFRDLKNASLVCKDWEWHAKAQLFYKKTVEVDDFAMERFDFIAFRLGRVIRHLRIQNPDPVTIIGLEDEENTGRPAYFEKVPKFLERSLRALPVLKEITLEVAWLWDVQYHECHPLFASVIEMLAARKRVSERPSSKVSRLNICAKDFKQIDGICGLVKGNALEDFVTWLRVLNIHSVDPEENILTPAFSRERPTQWTEDEEEDEAEDDEENEEVKGKLHLFESLCSMQLDSITTLKLRFHKYETSLCRTALPVFNNLRHLNLQGLQPTAANLLSTMIMPSRETLLTIDLTNILLCEEGTFAILFQGIMKCEKLSDIEVSCCTYRHEAGITPDVFFVLQEQPWWNGVCSSDLKDLHAFRDLIHKVLPIEAAEWAGSSAEWTNHQKQPTPAAKKWPQIGWIAKLASFEKYQRLENGCCWDDQSFRRSAMSLHHLMRAYPFSRPKAWEQEAPYASSYGHGGPVTGEPGLRTIEPMSAEDAARVWAADPWETLCVQRNGTVSWV